MNNDGFSAWRPHSLVNKLLVVGGASGGWSQRQKCGGNGGDLPLTGISFQTGRTWGFPHHATIATQESSFSQTKALEQEQWGYNPMNHIETSEGTHLALATGHAKLVLMGAGSQPCSRLPVLSILAYPLLPKVWACFFIFHPLTAWSYFNSDQHNWNRADCVHLDIAQASYPSLHCCLKGPKSSLHQRSGMEIIQVDTSGS